VQNEVEEKVVEVRAAAGALAWPLRRWATVAFEGNGPMAGESTPGWTNMLSRVRCGPTMGKSTPRRWGIKYDK
jgi:hypothetical protein